MNHKQQIPKIIPYVSLSIRYLEWKEGFPGINFCVSKLEENYL